MKRLQILFISIVLALCAAAPAHAGHGHARVGVFIGPAWYPPYYPYYYPPYYYPPYYYPAATPTYIEQAPAIVPGYWYYCGGSAAYYPYVRECPGGWQRVSPQPAS